MMSVLTSCIFYLLPHLLHLPLPHPPFHHPPLFFFCFQVFFSTAVASGSMYIFGQHHCSPKTVKKQVSIPCPDLVMATFRPFFRIFPLSFSPRSWRGFLYAFFLSFQESPSDSLSVSPFVGRSFHRFVTHDLGRFSSEDLTKEQMKKQ